MVGWLLIACFIYTHPCANFHYHHHTKPPTSSQNKQTNNQTNSTANAAALEMEVRDLVDEAVLQPLDALSAARRRLRSRPLRCLAGADDLGGLGGSVVCVRGEEKRADLYLHVPITNSNILSVVA